jgi:Retrotransposon gag protein
MAKAAGIKAPTFSGRADEDADGFITAFERYVKYRDITEAAKKLNLFVVLLHNSAAQWLDSLPDSSKDTFEHLSAVFAERYRLTESIKFKCANDLFSRKQLPDESVDDYVTQMRRTARLINVDDNILQLVLVNGFTPWISAQVTQAKPESVDKILEVARLAELTMPKTTVTDGNITAQLVDLQTEMRRLSSKMDNVSITAVHPRSSTPERRADFNHPESAQSFTPPTYVPPDHHRNATFYRFNAQQVTDSRPQPMTYFNQQRQRGQRAHWQPPQSPTGSCSRCGRNHGMHAFCPARDPNKVCNYCHKRGHFQAVCFSASKQY